MVFKCNERLNEVSIANINEAKSDLKIWGEKLVHQNVILGKQHKFPFPESKTKSRVVCELIHMDLCGQMERQSIGGSKYFLLLKDDYSHYRKVYFLQKKKEVKHCLEVFLNSAENSTVTTGSKI